VSSILVYFVILGVIITYSLLTNTFFLVLSFSGEWRRLFINVVLEGELI